MVTAAKFFKLDSVESDSEDEERTTSKVAFQSQRDRNSIKKKKKNKPRVDHDDDGSGKKSKKKKKHKKVSGGDEIALDEGYRSHEKALDDDDDAKRDMGKRKRVDETDLGDTDKPKKKKKKSKEKVQCQDPESEGNDFKKSTKDPKKKRKKKLIDDVEVENDNKDSTEDAEKKQSEISEAEDLKKSTKDPKKKKKKQSENPEGEDNKNSTEDAEKRQSEISEAEDLKKSTKDPKKKKNKRSEDPEAEEDNKNSPQDAEKKRKNKKKKQSEDLEDGEDNKNSTQDAEKKKKKKRSEASEAEENDLNSRENGKKKKKKKKQSEDSEAEENSYYGNEERKKKQKGSKSDEVVTTPSSKSAKKVNFSDQVEVFPAESEETDDEEEDEDKHVDMVRGKRFTKEEDELIKKAVLEYVDNHALGDEGINMVMNCKSHKQVRGCWKEIAAALPWRPYDGVYYRAHTLFEEGSKGVWSKEDLELVVEYQKKHGNDWRTLADAMGKHRKHVKDAWRRVRLASKKKGHWSMEEYQNLFDLVNKDLRMKAFQEKRSKHGMLRDNIPWMAISDQLGTRDHVHCCMKWYDQLTSPMVEKGIWANVDDYRLLDELKNLDAACVDDVDWDNLLDNRDGDACRSRWNQMVHHIGIPGSKTFAEQVEILSQRYCPDIAEDREDFDNRPFDPEDD